MRCRLYVYEITRYPLRNYVRLELDDVISMKRVKNVKYTRFKRILM